MAAVIRFLPRRQLSLPDWSARRHRVLYLRYDRIGDMILTTGVLRALKQAQPTLEIDVLASPANAAILRGNGHVRSVLVFDRRRLWTYPPLLMRLRRARYDAVLDGMVLEPSLTSLLIMLAAGAPYRIGVGGRRNEAAYTVPVTGAPADAQAVMHSAALVAPFGVRPSTDLRPELTLSGAERAAAEREWAGVSATSAGQRVLVNISAGQAYRRWPEDRYAAAVRHLLRRDPRPAVIVMAAPADGEQARRIAEAGGAAARTPALRDALALVATADLVFTPDTSISHAASAFGTPTVVMLTPSMALFVPYETVGRNVFADDSATLASLPLERVLPALDDVLAERPPRR